MHEQKRLVIVATVALMGFAGGVSAQKDAAEKAKEGGIDHWIEYYKGEQRKAATQSAKKPAAPPVDQAAPAAGGGRDSAVREDVLPK